MKRPMVNRAVASIYRRYMLTLMILGNQIAGSKCSIAARKQSNQHVFTVNGDRHARSTPANGRTKKHKRRYTVDSGASVHCINDRSMFDTVYMDHPPVRIMVANKQLLQAKTVGTVKLTMNDTHGKPHDITLHNVVYHPAFSENLLSVHRLWKDSRISTRFAGENMFVDKANNTRFKFEHITHGYQAVAHKATVSITPQLLHSRFGHCSERRLNQMRDRSINFPLNSHMPNIQHDPSTCDACQQGGMKRKPWGKRPKGKYTYFGEKLSSDLCSFPKSLQGYKYVLCIVDAYTNWLVTIPLNSKSSDNVRPALEAFLRKYAYALPSDKPITWHTDNGGEFMSTDLNEFCDEFCVHRSFSTPYGPPTNAHAERMWGLLLRTTRILLVQSGVHESLWWYAVQQATMLHNYMPSTRLTGEMSPHEALTGKLPDVTKIRTWGCIVWYHLNPQDRPSKIAPRAVPAVHLGLDPTRNDYIVFVPFLNRITTARHVSFQEHRFMVFDDDGIASMPRHIKPLKGTEHRYREERDDLTIRKKRLRKPHAGLSPSENPSGPAATPSMGPSNAAPPPARNDDDSNSDYEDADDKPYWSERPTRAETEDKGKNPERSTRKPPDFYTPVLTSVIMDDVQETILSVDAQATLSDIVVPQSFESATKSRFAHRWWEAMKAEMQALMEHGTWETVNKSDVPKGKKITKSRWCYTIKHNRDGSIERFKARFVVCGYSQVQGEDYTHAFSATLRATSFRLLMAIAAGEKLRMEHFDVKNAFTQSDIDAEIYTEPAKGFEEKGKDGHPKIYKLIKSLYGTKQASRLWQMKLRDHLVRNMGFKCSLNDPCMYVKRDDKGGVMILGVYVDDIILAHKNVDVNVFIDQFCGKDGFNSKHLGRLSWFLGMSIDQHEDSSVHINQEQYVKKLVEKFLGKKVEKRCQPHKPLPFQRLKPASEDIEREKASRLPYLQLIGSLLYLSCMTRPDIAYNMAVLCSMMHDPTVDAYEAALDVLRFVASTPHTHLTFTGSCVAPSGIPMQDRPCIETNKGLVVYSDASWRKPDQLGYNMFGYVVYLYGGPVAFAAKKLKVIALSTAEAEYAAASYSCKELQFIRSLSSFLGVKLDGPTVVAVDNQAAIKIAENMGVTAHNKHFTDAIHYLRHLYDHLVARPVFVTTKNQRADGFTKALDRQTFKEWQKCVVDVPE